MAKAEDNKIAEEVEVKSEPSTAVAETEPSKGTAGPLRLWDFERDFEHAMENFFNRRWLRSPRWGFPSLKETFEERMPKVNIIDRDDEIVIEAELPGITKDDLDVSLTENTVTIKASSRKEETEEKGDYHRREISSREYTRTLPIPVVVDRDAVKADFKDGLLTLTMPKAEQSKRRSIKVD